VILKLAQRIFPALFLLVALWGFAFSSFLAEVARLRPAEGSADGIVVLTGGIGRLDAGVSALRGGLGRKLLITGANPTLRVETILDALALEPELRACCVDIDQRATDTAGNVRETAAWAERNGFHTLLIITSDYHLPRTLVLFRARGADFNIEPWPVASGFSPFALASEFNKYLITRLWTALGGTA
jgi:uncharacterized SAM-binding protein YcdF (DUF218 family)